MMLWKPVSKVVIIVNKLIPQSYIERLNAIAEKKALNFTGSIRKWTVFLFH
jgi:hypothetical protein